MDDLKMYEKQNAIYAYLHQLVVELWMLEPKSSLSLNIASWLCNCLSHHIFVLLARWLDAMRIQLERVMNVVKEKQEKTLTKVFMIAEQLEAELLI